MYSDLLPVAALIRRELLTSLRQQRYFWLFAMGILIAVLFTALEWPDAQTMPRKMVLRSAEIFSQLMVVLMAGIALIIPALSGASIVTERDEETFELLAMTSARPWHVLLAKLVNSAGHYLLMLIALMPLAASAFFLVGLDVPVLWHSLLLCSSVAIACAAAGVMCSCLFHRTPVAVGASYFAMLCIIGLPQVLVLAVLHLLSIIDFDTTIDGFAAFVLPIAAIDTAFGNGRPALSGFHAVEICSTLQLCFAAAMIFVVHRFVRNNWGQGFRQRSQTTAPSKALPKAQARASKVFPDAKNPIMMRELRYDFSMERWAGLFVFSIPCLLAGSASVLLIVINFANASRVEDAFFGWQLLQAVLFPIIFAASAGNIFTKELERGNLDALRMTGLSAGSIVAGKLAAVFRVAAIMMMAAFTGGLPVLLAAVPLAGWSALENIAGGYAMLGECMIMTWAIVVFSSCVARRTTSALLLTFVLGGLAIFGVYVVGANLGAMLLNSAQSRWVEALSPLSTFMICFSNNDFDERIWFLALALTASITAMLVVATYWRYHAARAMDY